MKTYKLNLGVIDLYIHQTFLSKYIGEALSSMLCFDFSRPNCAGSKLAAEHLTEYGKQFIQEYGHGGSTSSSSQRTQPWAAFMHFIDSHEDTSTLVNMLDKPIHDFLRSLRDDGYLNNTVVAVVSDHGLHYGPYFQSHKVRVDA